MGIVNQRAKRSGMSSVIPITLMRSMPRVGSSSSAAHPEASAHGERLVIALGAGDPCDGIWPRVQTISTRKWSVWMACPGLCEQAERSLREEVGIYSVSTYSALNDMHHLSVAVHVKRLLRVRKYRVQVSIAATLPRQMVQLHTYF